MVRGWILVTGLVGVLVATPVGAQRIEPARLVGRTMAAGVAGTAAGIAGVMLSGNGELTSHRLVFGGVAYVTTVAMVTAGLTKPERCSWNRRISRAFLGALAGAGIATAVVRGINRTHIKGAPAAAAGVTIALSTPLGASLAEAPCD
jgi:hypothetical protein